ncbi:MAG: hypothetical protein R3C18_24125 [Planctomycetaceae bacterium]
MNLQTTTALAALAIQLLLTGSANAESVKLPKFVRIKSQHTQKYMRTDSDKWIYADASSEGAIIFETIRDGGNYYFKVKGTGVYLSYRDSTGAVKLYDSGDDASYEIKGGSTMTIRNVYHDQYMWVDGKAPYITGAGAGKGDEKRWIFEEVK